MENKTFDQAWHELENLMTEMEDEAMPLDALAVKVKTARQLIRYCEDKLRSIEKDLTNEDAPASEN